MGALSTKVDGADGAEYSHGVRVTVNYGEKGNYSYLIILYRWYYSTGCRTVCTVSPVIHSKLNTFYWRVNFISHARSELLRNTAMA